MCGIFGLISEAKLNKEEANHVLKLGMSRIAHRGPDGDGAWVDPDGNAVVFKTKRQFYERCEEIIQANTESRRSLCE